jgi:hypothetical protein
MLDFYGMRVVDMDSGLLDRSLPPRDFVARYRNLVREYLIQAVGERLTCVDIQALHTTTCGSHGF